MTFKELHTGSPVFFLTGKNDEMDIRQGVVKQGPGMPHSPTPQPGQAVNYMAPSVVDIEIELDGQSKQYEIQDAAEYTYGGGMLIATDIKRILSEVESIKAQALERYNNREKDKACIERCDELRLKYDPRAKEQKALDDRFRGIEEGQRKFQENMTSQMDRFTDRFESMMNKMMKKFDN